jgi:hypothetical protein
MITDRDIDVLKALAHYYVLNRKQIEDLFFADRGPRVARRRLEALHDAKLVNRANVQTYHVGEQSPPVVYYPTKLMGEFLKDRTGDERYLLIPHRAPISHHVQHWLAVSDTHILFDHALKSRTDLTIESWLNEWDVANKDESDPQKHFKLYTLIRQQPKLVCIPDAGFLLSTQGFKKVFYIEQDRGTSGADEVASQKSKGYAALAEEHLHKKHFPESNVSSFMVLLIAPNQVRRESLRRAFRGKPGADLWRFVAASDMEPSQLFSSDIFFPCEGDPRALIKKKDS